MVMCWCSSSRSCSTNKQTSVGKDSAENDHCDSWWSKRLKSVRQHEQAEDWVHSTCLCSSNVSSFEMRDSRREKKEIDTSSGSGQRKFHRSRAQWGRGAVLLPTNKWSQCWQLLPTISLTAQLCIMQPTLTDRLPDEPIYLRMYGTASRPQPLLM